MGVNPAAIEVMSEVGIDISGQKSQSIEEFVDQPFDLVITVCSYADRLCPTFPGGGPKLHWPFDDPFGVTGDTDAALDEFRRVRDEIGERIREWLEHES